MIKDQPIVKCTAGVFLFIFLCVISSVLPGHASDQNLWRHWTHFIYSQGLSHAYESGTDYLPLYQYFMWIFGKLAHNAESISVHLGYLRSFTIAFEFFGLWYVYVWMEKKVDYLFLLLFSLLNISFSYNTIIWGQVDAIMTALLFISLYYAHRKKILLSGLFMVLALNMKLQSIIFLPAWGLLCLYAVVSTRNWKSIFYAVISMALLQLFTSVRPSMRST